MPQTKLRHPNFNKLHLFKAPNGKSNNWYCGFHHGGKYIRTSTQSPILNEALRYAQEWYLRTLYGNGPSKENKTFSAYIDRLPKRMLERGRSPRYAVAVTNTLLDSGYLCRYFGKILVADIDGQAWEGFREWLASTREIEGRPSLSEATIHQLKNSVRLILREAYVDKQIASIPKFADVNRSKRADNRPRVFFSHDEFGKLLNALIDNVISHMNKKTRWREDSKELLDYVYFMSETGLRVSECKALRVRDVAIVDDTLIVNGEEKTEPILKITITGGKLGGHPPCVSSPFAVDVFKHIVSRRHIQNPESCGEPLFLKHHRDAFKNILRKCGLYTDAYGRKRDFVGPRRTEWVRSGLLSGRRAA